MDNVYNEPGASTQQRHLINNTEAELSAGLGKCQEGIGTDTGRHTHKDHLGAFKKSALTTELDYVKVSATDDTPGRLDAKVVKKPSSAITVAVDGTDDHLEIGVDGDDTTVETSASKLRVKAESITDSHIAPAAAIAESKLALNYATHSNANDPTSGEKAALPGTSGTPSGTNKYVTNDDVRNTNDRYPTTHGMGGGSHGADSLPNIKSKVTSGTLITSDPAEISTLTLKGTPVTNDLLMIEDSADSNNKKRITVGSIAAGAHAIGGAIHTADTIANIKTKVSDGSLITTAAGEITALTEKTTPLGVDMVLAESIADTNAKREIAVSNLAYLRDVLLLPENFLYPNNSEWTINSAAPIDLDPSNNSIIIRGFDDSTEEGVGFVLSIPLNCVSMSFTFRCRAGSSFGSRNVVMSLFTRQMAHNVAYDSWSSRTNFSTITFPTNQYYQKITETITLATLGLTAGNRTLFELTRNATSGSDTLAADFNLANLLIKFN
jgi:hypothetical protein